MWVVGIGGCATMVGSIPFVLKSSDAYHMTMDAIRADTRVKAAIGEDVTDNFWVGGNLDVNANGAGDAQFSIPVHGAKGKGTVYSHLVRNAGSWSTRLLVVRVDGEDAPIVLTNEDHVPIPNGNRNINFRSGRNAKTALHRERGFARYAGASLRKQFAKLYGHLSNLRAPVRET